MSNSNNYIEELRVVVNTTITEIEQLPVQKLTEHFTTDTVKDMILPQLKPLQQALKEFDSAEFGKVEEKAHNIHSIKKLRNAVLDTIKEIESIPEFKTEIEGKSWSSEQLKGTIMPLLNQSQNRINDIENVANQIDSVRNEILEPVKKVIEEKDKNSKIFSWVGIFIGVMGIIPMAYNYISSFTKSEKKEQTQLNDISPTVDNNSVAEILRIEGKTFSNKCFNLEKDIANIIEKNSLLLQGENGTDKIKNAKNNLISKLPVDPKSECLNSFEKSGLMEKVYLNLGLLNLKLKDNDRFIAIYNEYTRRFEKKSDKNVENTFKIIHLEKFEKNTKKELVKKLRSLQNNDNSNSIISPDNFDKIPMNQYLNRRVHELEDDIFKENFVIWIYDYTKNNYKKPSGLIKELKDAGYVKAKDKGSFSKGTFEQPWVYYRSPSVQNSTAFKIIKDDSNRYNLGNRFQSLSTSQSKNIRTLFDENPSVQILIMF